MLLQVSRSGEREVIEIIAKLAKDKETICVVGPSSSGKSYYASKLAEALGGTVISTDDFYRADSWKISAILSTFDHPYLIDWDLLMSTIYEAREKEYIEVPIYDMRVSARTGYKRIKVSKPLIIEGIFASYGPLRELCEFRVAFESPLHLLLARRMLRDTKRAMEAPSRVLDRVVRTVFPMAKLFVEPQINSADVKVYNDWRPDLPEKLGKCEKGEGEGNVEGERRVIKLSYEGDSVYIIENFIDDSVEHYVLVSWGGKFIGARVHPETAYATLSALSAHRYSLESYLQKGKWKGEIIIGNLVNEKTWEELGKRVCCKLCVP
ncbi:hypothetical protein IPA_01345 [Ignicoccus pacificus DSM 13166]|uniref:Phosphoribulokinase/uridine kinase domain-containing protein n=1 Tax=Ignicoccus pacificus DSM 13166 TaxID=940294 RepID=A0A977KAH4_9CREN|nr:hypothetical protein IPA_01345 [Ignicoccus pacificus DSM 13166]